MYYYSHSGNQHGERKKINETEDSCRANELECVMCCIFHLNVQIYYCYYNAAPATKNNNNGMNVWIFWRLLQRSVEWTRHHFFQHEMWWLWRKFRAPFSLNWRTKQEISVKTKAHKKFIRHYSLGHTPLKCKVASALICSLQNNAHVCEKWWHTDWNFSVIFSQIEMQLHMAHKIFVTLLSWRCWRVSSLPCHFCLFIFEFFFCLFLLCFVRFLAKCTQRTMIQP